MWLPAINLFPDYIIDNTAVDGHLACCNYNCDQYISVFGGIKTEGILVYKHISLDLFQCIKHFVVLIDGILVDVTPFQYSDPNVFIPGVIIPGYNLYTQSLESINKQSEQEADIMFYVYMYIDPTTMLPLYVGKGTQNRASIHKTLCKQPKNKQNQRFYNKLRKMIDSGIEPIIQFIAQNIENEAIAYQIETAAITKFGRVGYDKDGILLNICEGSRPPNHKGKTYQEIYGDSWQQQIDTRRQTQIQRGGFGPRKHSDQLKLNHSLRFSGSGNPRFGVTVSDETRTKISKANLGRKVSTAAEYTLDHSDGREFIIKSIGSVKIKSVELNICFSTLQNQLYKSWPRAKSGKTKGWYLQRN